MKSNTLEKNFIQKIIDEDLASDKWGGKVHTRFPPSQMGIYILAMLNLSV